MNLTGLTVKHKTFGQGTVIKAEDTYITVEFKEKTAKFLIPSSCEKFICFDDESIQKAMLQQIAEDVLKKQAEERVKKEQEEARQKALIEQAKSPKKTAKLPKRENIAFKCNYCDGGKSNKDIGFHGVCSDETIKYNIQVAHHTWCSNGKCPCNQYLNGNITKDELIAAHKDNLACYESRMLDSWTAYAGEKLTGENKGVANRLVHVQNKSLAVLTTRFPNTEEEERIVFAVFLVDDSYEGDNLTAGYVTTNSKYKNSLTENEAKQIKYWNYYFNPNSAEKAHWGTGLHRYINDIQAAQILKDIVNVKSSKAEKEFAEEFLNHFCEINNIDSDNLPEPDGALIL